MRCLFWFPKITLRTAKSSFEISPYIAQVHDGACTYMHAKRFFSPLEISLELRYPLISMVWSPQPIERCLFQI